MRRKIAIVIVALAAGVAAGVAGPARAERPAPQPEPIPAATRVLDAMHAAQAMAAYVVANLPECAAEDGGPYPCVFDGTTLILEDD